MECLTANGHSIAYRHRPSIGRTIVFANSLGSDQSIWDHVIDHLPGGYGLVTYDLPGHGLSDGDADDGIDGLADDLIGLIETLGLGDVLLCGLSIGGMIAQSLAARRPDLLGALILCNTSITIGDQDRWRQRIRSARTDGLDMIAESIVETWFGSAYRAAFRDRIPMHQAMVARTSSAGYASACEAIRDADLTLAARAISVPTLCIGGSEDRSVSEAAVKEMAAHISGAKTQILAGVGHLPCLEAPRRLARLIEDFDPPRGTTGEIGTAIRCRVLGDTHVARATDRMTDLDRAFQTLITEGAWGTVWASAGLSARERSMLTLALLAALGNFDEIPMHVRATIRTGTTERDIAEAFQHVAIYAGVPRANRALTLARQVLAELKAGADG